MTKKELLLNLRDIQPPLEPAWWHLSSVTISLIVLVLAGTVFVWWVYKRHRANWIVDHAGTELERIVANHKKTGDEREFALDLAHWLKRVALIAFPDRQLESLSGGRWLEFLDQSMGAARFTRGCGRIFGGAVYRGHVSIDASEAAGICRQWLTAVKPQLQKQGRYRC